MSILIESTEKVAALEQEPSDGEHCTDNNIDSNTWRIYYIN